MKTKNRFWLFIVLLMSACYKESDLDPSSRNLDNLFSLFSSLDSIPADGANRLMLYVKGLPEEISDSDNHIILTTDFGTFDGGTVAGKITVTSTLVFDTLTKTTIRLATATLIADTKVDSVHITATVKGVTKYKTLFFYPAKPDRVSIVPSLIFAKASFVSPITIDIATIRDTGLVSLNTKIGFSATDTAHGALPHEAGMFQGYNPYTDLTGKVHFIYFFTDTTYQGTVKLKAISMSPQGKTIQDSINLNIYK